MNKRLALLMALCVMMVSAFFPCSSYGSYAPGGEVLQIAATGKTDFPGMYKQFLSTMIGAKYDTVWDSLAKASKDRIAVAIANDAKSPDVAGIMTMLNKDEDSIRTIFLGTFVHDGDVAGIVNNGLFSLKSESEHKAVITITLHGEPKDFKIITEDNGWKFDFFTDLLSE
jgi:hypothetical protein